MKIPSPRIPAILSSILLAGVLLTACTPSPDPEIDIHYLGHSSFVLRFDDHTTVVTDHGHENAWVDWGWDSPILGMGDLVPDVMTFSHEHEDHYDPERIPRGVSHILKDLDSLEIRGVSIRPIRTCEADIHTESNTSYLFLYKGLKILHLGDAQAQIMHIEDEEVKNHILAILPESLDLLMMPIQGVEEFIPQAEAFLDLLRPRRVLVMHSWSEAYRDAFLAFLRARNEEGEAYDIRRVESAQVSISRNPPSNRIEVISLTHAPFARFDPEGENDF